MHKVLCDDGVKTIKKPQRWFNPIKTKVRELLSFDIKWASQEHVVPKKTDITNLEIIINLFLLEYKIVEEFVSIIGDKTKLQEKIIPPPPFVILMLKWLASKSHYCFLDGIFWLFSYSYRSRAKSQIYLSIW